MGKNENRFKVSLLLMVTATLLYILYVYLDFAHIIIRSLFLTLAIINTVFATLLLLFGILYISVHPTDIAVKIRFKRFTGKILQGGWCFWFPFLEDFIIFDSRIQTMWISFLGPRGHNSKTQVREFEHFKEKFLIVDKKRYYTQAEQDFNATDFYTFGPLYSANREEIDLMCAINYRIVNPLKLAKALNIIENKDEEKAKFKPMLVAKVTSALKETVARMTLDEVFEERQKLMELLVRSLNDTKDDWGIDVMHVAIEEQWIEDEKLQEMLDEKKKAEIITDAKQIVEKHDAEIKNLIVKAEQDKETMLAKAREEVHLIQESTKLEGAKLRQELMELRAESEKVMVETQSKSRTIIAQAEGKRLELINRVLDEKIIEFELINTIPMIMDAVSLANEKFILVPSKKMNFLPFFGQGKTEEDTTE